MNSGIYRQRSYDNLQNGKLIHSNNQKHNETFLIMCLLNVFLNGVHRCASG